MDKIQCPFVYASGKKCTGHVARVEVYKADISWVGQPDGTWGFAFDPRSHFHLFCSERDNHAGYARRDDERMKFYADTLPKEIWQAIKAARLLV